MVRVAVDRLVVRAATMKTDRATRGRLQTRPPMVLTMTS
jgi:hypothetical protein